MSFEYTLIDNTDIENFKIHMDVKNTKYEAHTLSKNENVIEILTRKVPNTTIAEFANIVHPDGMAHIEPSHLDLHRLPCSL